MGELDGESVVGGLEMTERVPGQLRPHCGAQGPGEPF